MSNFKNIKMPRKEKKPISHEEQLVKWIETLTHSGLENVDKEIMTNIKRLCKRQQSLIEKAYCVLLRELKKTHAEIRLSSFQIIKELFSKSHIFRVLALKDLELILDLTVGIELQPLPPPKHVADNLKKLALSTLQDWKSLYGSTYKQLIICYNYLVRTKGIDFMAVIREIEDQIRVRAHRDELIMRMKLEKMRKLQEEFDGTVGDMESAVDVVTNCVSLLMPTPDDFFVPSDANTEDADIFSYTKAVNEDDNFEMRQFGLSHSYNLTITLDLNKKVFIKRTQENSSIIDNLKENIMLIRKRFLPKTRVWKNICVENSDNNNQSQSVEYIVKKMEDCLKKCEELRVEGICHSDIESDDDDDDFVVVDKEGFEPSAPDAHDDEPSTSKHQLNGHKPSLNKQEKKSKSLAITNNFHEDHHKPKAKVRKDEISKNETPLKLSGQSSQVENNQFLETGSSDVADPSSSGNRRERLLSVAPKLPFDIDLYHWEDENLAAPTLLSVKMDNPKFWGSGDIDDRDEIQDPRGVAALRTRVIEYSGKFEPVKWTCRAPLASGELCPRRDRVKCPFHGAIVARDESGKCVNPEDEKPSGPIANVNPEPEKEIVPDWQDPQLLAELKAATGIDLKMPDKKKKKKDKKKKEDGEKKPRRKRGQPSSDVLENIKKRNFPGLSDIHKKDLEPKVRLKKKIFNRSALRRVAADETKRQHRRHRDKFGDQFNYVFHSS